MCDLQGYKLSLPALCKDLVLEEDFELSPLYENHLLRRAPSLSQSKAIDWRE